MSYLDNLFNLQGKVAVLTGGGGVLAGKMAEGFVKVGVKVVLLDLRLENAQKCADSLVAMGGEAIALESNVLDIEILKKTKDTILQKFGRIDILVNAAGGNMPGATISPDKTFFDLKFDDFKKVTDLNLNGTVLPTMIFGEVMANQKSGNIINIASMASLQAITRVVGYSAAKAAVMNFTMWSAMEMAQKFGGGIRVNALAPGFFIGDQNRALLLNTDGSLTPRGQQVINKTPMGRFGEADELIGAVLYLCSDAAKFVTGITLPVDGGFSTYSGV